MDVAVTGVSGFLGAHLVRVLLEQGHRVRGLARPGRTCPDLEGLELQILSGDLELGDVPDGFFDGAEVVLHLAAIYSERASDEGLMNRVNVLGTRAVLEGAVRHGVPRVLHCSTMGSCAPATHGGSATEADRPDPELSSPYNRTKLAAEDLALSFEGVEVVVANPAAPVGAYDRKPTVTGRRVRDVVRGQWPRLLAGPVNHVPARACARGLWLAATRGVPGERYLLGGENLDPEAFLERLARAADREVPRRGLWLRFRGKGRPAPGSLAIDDTKARRALGYESGDLDAAFTEAAHWFRAV